MTNTKPNVTSHEKQEKNLKKAANDLRNLLAKADRGNLAARYAVGLIVRGLRDEAAYGSNAVARMAGEIGLDKNTLYRFAVVARTWSKEELDELLKRDNRYGLPLTWSHLDVLANVEDVNRRETLIRGALGEGWTVKALREAIASGKAESAQASVPEAGESDLAASVRKLEDSVRLVVAESDEWS